MYYIKKSASILFITIYYFDVNYRFNKRENSIKSGVIPWKI